MRRANDRQIASAKRIGDAVYERKFRPDDSEIRPHFFCKRGKGANIARVDCNALRFRRNSCVAGRAPDFFHDRAFAELPDEMLVFASQHDDWDEPNRVSAAEVQEVDIGRALILKATDYYDDEDEEEDE